MFQKRRMFKMATRKPRANPKSKDKPLPPPPAKFGWRLDQERWKEIAAIIITILAALTAVGALNLSGGVVLGTWTQLLQGLFGWGVYVAPLFLLALGAWLFFDAIKKAAWDIGWERPLGLGSLFLLILLSLHWLSALADPLRQPGPFQGGGVIGWAVLALLIGALGEVGTLCALIAGLGITLILLFNLSLPEFVRRVLFFFDILLHLPREIKKFRTPRPAPQQLPLPPAVEIRRAPAPAELAPADKPARPAREKMPARVSPPVAPPPPQPVAEPALAPGSNPPAAPSSGQQVHIVGKEDAPPNAPVIQREWTLPNLADILIDPDAEAKHKLETDPEQQAKEQHEQEAQEQKIRERVHIIEETLQHFGVPVKVTSVNIGPTITQYGVEPDFIEQKGADGKVHRVKVKVSRILALQHDLELALAAAPIRIQAPVPGKSIVGIEVPNPDIAMVSLRGVMESASFQSIKSKLRVALGQDVGGDAICADLAKMPHLLVAGATGSGKSVCINTIIAGLLCTATPAEVQFIMIDPKRVELINFNGIPHLREPVVVEMERAVEALQGAVTEMDRRFQVFAQQGARNIEIYTHMIENQPDAERLPYLVVIVDELADLMMIAAEEVERAITRLAQMARATGIHLILATQRPSVDVVTGLIKANFPSRISFAVTSQIDSRVVLDTPGAEKLLGRGDMLYMASDSSKLTRLQGCFVSDRELEKLVAYWRDLAPPSSSPSPAAPPDYQQTSFLDKPLTTQVVAPLEDDLLPEAITVVRQSHRASVSLLQRKLRVGYSRAARLIELLEEKGIVGPDDGPTKGRMVLPATPDAALDATRPPNAIPARASPPRAKKSAPPPNAARQFDQADDDDFDDWTEEDWADLDKE